jgi:uncharacterized protein YcfJ
MAKRKRKEKKSNFVEDTSSEFSVYKRGAFIGGVFGGIAGFTFGRKIVLGILVGSLLGGYISYEINKEK